MSLYEAQFKTTDGETFKGWMGSDLPSKRGFTTIKLETAGLTAFIPDNEIIEDTIKAGKMININEIITKEPEKTPGDTGPVVDGNPHAGTYYKPSKVKPGSKLEAVVNLINNNPGLSRKEYIQMAIDKVGMTPAGASTYVNNAKPFINK